MNGENTEQWLQTFENLKKEFEKIYRRYYHPSRPVSKNENILNEYKTDTEDVYNRIVEFNKKYLNKLDEKNKQVILGKVDNIQYKLSNAYETLKIKQKIPTNYLSKIKITTIAGDIYERTINFHCKENK